MFLPRPRPRPSEPSRLSSSTGVDLQWLDARATGRALGVSEKTLARWRKAGLLQVGIHWRRKLPSANSPVLYQLELCNRTMNEVTARSAAVLET